MVKKELILCDNQTAVAKHQYVHSCIIYLKVIISTERINHFFNLLAFKFLEIIII